MGPGFVTADRFGIHTLSDSPVGASEPVEVSRGSTLVTALLLRSAPM